MAGIQTHRSFWVAGKHLESLESKDGRKFVRTRDRREVPVSRRRDGEVNEFLRKTGIIRL